MIPRGAQHGTWGSRDTRRRPGAGLAAARCYRAGGQGCTAARPPASRPGLYDAFPGGKTGHG